MILDIIVIIIVEMCVCMCVVFTSNVIMMRLLGFCNG